MAKLNFVLPLLRLVREKLLALNLFETSSTDPLIIHRQLLSTRLFCILLTTSCVVLVGFNLINKHVKHETVPLPSFALYQKLENKYSESIKCPCEKLSVPYKTFIQLVPNFHQVCSSYFVSDVWINLTFNVNLTMIWPIDARKSMSAIWQLIRTLCRTAIQIMATTLKEFVDSPLVNSEILSEKLLKAKAEASVQYKHKTAAASLIQQLSLIRGIIQSDELVTALSTNYIAVTEAFGLAFNLIESEDGSHYIGITDNKYIIDSMATPCSCSNNRSCPMPANLYLYPAYEMFGIYNFQTIPSNGTLKGITLDCFPLLMVLSSTLECFYNQSCLNTLLLGYSNPISILPLNESKSSRYVPNAKIDDLIHELFVENIESHLDYQAYYDECAPLSCSYVYSQRFDWIYSITFFVALFGGLNATMKFLSPQIINILYYVKNRRSRARQVSSSSSML